MSKEKVIEIKINDVTYIVSEVNCQYHNGIVGNHRLKMLVSNSSFSFDL